MLVRIHVDAVDDISDFKTSMEVSFTNNPYAGAYKLSKDSYSEMHTVYNADTNAAYQSSFLFVHERHPIVRQKPIVYVEGMKENDTRLDDQSYLVFRTRTEVDEKGNLVSAHYGKIDGLWEFFGSMRAASIQFNPIPNDTNLEVPRRQNIRVCVSVSAKSLPTRRSASRLGRSNVNADKETL